MGYEQFRTKSLPQLQKHIRTTSGDSSSIVILKHASVRMNQRQISRLEVFECLRKGVIRRVPEPDLKRGTLNCRMEHYLAGRDCMVIVALYDQRPDLIVVTVMTA